MTSFKEISVEDYKKLLDNRQHTFAKTFKNTQLLQNFEKPKIKNNIDNIIKEENQIKKEDDYIEKLSNKISNKLQPKSNESIEDDGEKEYNFLNNANYYIENPKTILSTIKDIYLKSNIPFENVYLPRESTKYVYVDTIINNNNNIPDEIKYNFVRDYNNVVNKTNIKYSRQDYEKYVLNPIFEHYNQGTRDEKNESLKDKLRSDISKTIIKSVVGEGIFDKIKIDKDL